MTWNKTFFGITHPNQDVKDSQRRKLDYSLRYKSTSHNDLENFITDNESWNYLPIPRGEGNGTIYMLW